MSKVICKFYDTISPKIYFKVYISYFLFIYLFPTSFYGETHSNILLYEKGRKSKETIEDDRAGKQL